MDLLRKENKDVHEEYIVQIYHDLRTLADSHRDDVEVIWRFARACYEYAETITDTNLKRMIILEGKYEASIFRIT